MKVFHGGCLGCTQQDIHGEYFCVGCQYFQADWTLPDLGNQPPTEDEIARTRIKRKLAERGINVERTSAPTMRIPAKPTLLTRFARWLS